MDLELANKTAIVTGGSQGIGKAVALELSREGANVIIVARTESNLKAAAVQIFSTTNREVHPIVCDTSSTDDVKRMVSEAIGRFEKIDVLVNAAGQTSGGAAVPGLADLTDDYFWSDINVKTIGYLRCIREVVPHMARGGGGRIVNIGGLGARSTGALVRSMRNVAVASLTKSLADELGDSQISLCVVHPGSVRTESTEASLGRRAERLSITVEQAENDLSRGSALGRMIRAQEIAWLVAFLASARAVAINGDAVIAAGGALGSIYY